MEFKKVNLDRKNLSSSYIERKQDFNHVLKSAKIMKTPMWNSPWFYGAIGLSSVAIAAMVLTENNFKLETNDKTDTLKELPNYQSKEYETKKVISSGRQTADQVLNSIKETDKSIVSLAVMKESIASYSVEESAKQPLIETKGTIENQSAITLEKKNSKFPLIGQPTVSGVASGEISCENLRNTNLIESNSSFEITSYEVQYYDGSKDITAVIQSNKLPTMIKDQIIENNMDEMIFITGIKGIDEEGKIRRLPSINLLIMR